MLPDTDQTGDPFTLNHTPRRIVSLVPSQTELLFHLGLDTTVVGITKFCVHPEEWFRSKTRIGGTKQVEIDRIRMLDPDLIIGNKEENTREDIEALRAEFPVYVSDVATVADALEMISGIGAITGKSLEAETLVATLRDRHAALLFGQSGLRPIRAAYLIWKDPFMAAGRDTFIDSMMHSLGWINVFGGEVRYPETDLKEISSRCPEVLLLSSEPYPFSHKHLEELQKSLVGIPVVLVDGEYFSWYGSRMLEAFGYLKALDTELRRRTIDKDRYREKP
jgi:ABC-type Fe3+-hydroxamate transport system substrate-binding protein